MMLEATLPKKDFFEVMASETSCGLDLLKTINRLLQSLFIEECSLEKKSSRN